MGLRRLQEGRCNARRFCDGEVGLATPSPKVSQRLPTSRQRSQICDVFLRAVASSIAVATPPVTLRRFRGRRGNVGRRCDVLAGVATRNPELRRRLQACAAWGWDGVMIRACASTAPTLPGGERPPLRRSCEPGSRVRPSPPRLFLPLPLRRNREAARPSCRRPGCGKAQRSADRGVR